MNKTRYFLEVFKKAEKKYGKYEKGWLEIIGSRDGRRLLPLL